MTNIQVVRLKCHLSTFNHTSSTRKRMYRYTYSVNYTSSMRQTKSQYTYFMVLTKAIPCESVKLRNGIFDYEIFSNPCVMSIQNLTE